jgi:UDP-4-amino-4,6-dideoxy-N-acetyl-beta-L-altrosamine N-acetyltransferase
MALRDAREDDLEDIRRWRDHPQVRASHIFTDPITPELHRAWWERVQTDPGRRVLIFERAGKACGVVTIMDHDPVARTAEWGFFLDIDGLQNDLLPAWMELEREAVAYGRDVLRLVAMGGRTLESNKQVLALHRRFGFVEVPERSYTATINGREQRVLWTELRMVP